MMCISVFFLFFFFKEEKLVNKKLIHFSQLSVSVQTYPSTHSHIHTLLRSKMNILNLDYRSHRFGEGSLLLNMLSRLVITFLPRSKCLLISWLQSPSVVIWEPRKIKSDTVSTVSPSISHEVIGTGCHDLRFLNVEL